MAIGRRQFCALLGVAALAPASLAQASQRRVGFLDESGKRGEWPLVVGLLTTGDPARHEGAIEALRHRYGYPRLLRYTSTDCRKADFAAAVVDYWAAASDLSFRALVVDGSRERWRDPGLDKDAAYAGIYRRLLASTDLDLRLKVRGDSERDRRLRKFIGGDLGYVLAEDTAPGNLTQLAGFLSGCIYGETTGNSHPVKVQLIDTLRRRVGSERLAEADARSFRVTRVSV